MTKRSTLLKVVAIIMIIFAAIALVALISTIGLVNSMLDYVGGWEAVELATGYNASFFMFAEVISIVECVFELICGILGVASKSKGLLEKLGLVLIIIAVVSLIVNIVGGTFTWTTLLGLILPILYFLGAKQCIQ